MNLRGAALFFGWVGLFLPLGGSAASTSLAWEQMEGYRVARLTIPANGRTGFTLLQPEQTGVKFTNQISYERLLPRRVLMEGGGVSAGDFDQDDLVDLYFCHVDGSNALFRNLGGFRFQDVTREAGVGCTNQASRGSVFADLNGDGALDLLVTSRGGPNACLLNEGNGHFRDITQEAGLVFMNFGCTSVTLADLKGDGTLTPYLVNNTISEGLDRVKAISYRMVDRKPQVAGRDAQQYQIVDGLLIQLGAPDAYYWNDARNHFSLGSWIDGTFLTEAGLPLKQAPRGLGLSAAFRDLNGDGSPDLYVCNDLQTPDRIWINDGKGHFRALPDLAIRTVCLNSMAVDFADLDRDGFDDLFVADMLSRSHGRRMTQRGEGNPSSTKLGESVDRQQARRNTLQLNRGDGTYADIANYAGVDASDWTWGTAFLDVDLDGFEDLLCVNGHAFDLQDLDAIERESRAGGVSADLSRGTVLTNYPHLATPNLLFRNRGDLSFEEKGAAWGFNSTHISHGLALADLDNDGDLDSIVSCLGLPPLIYRNETSAPRVAVRLKGTKPNTQGIGAKIIVRGGAVPSQSQEIQCGGRYLSSDQAIRVFAAGTLTNRLTLEVKWRSGRRSLIANADPNCLYEIDEAFSQSVSPIPPVLSSPKFFEDVSRRLGHAHEDPAFNDLERQPLLPKLLSKAGPGVAWFDLDGDGQEELILGEGRGRSLSAFKSDGNGGFTQCRFPLWNSPLPDDSTGLVGWTPVPGKFALLVGLSRYESDSATTPPVLRFEAGSAPTAALVGVPDLFSPGPLAVTDYDGDGDLDVFVGGRARPGRYPEPTASYLFRNDGGQLIPDLKNSAALKQVGLVNGAVFSDLDGDGYTELILACEWGPVRVFSNNRGRFREVTAELGLANFTGWWSGVTTGDFNGDGRLDILASNWGLNSSYHRPSARQPVGLFYGDFDDNGSMDILETEYEEVNFQLVPRRDLSFLAQGWPGLRARFATHRSFASADAMTVLGEAWPRAKQVQAATLASMLFLNRGEHFEGIPLPAAAQFAPGFAVCVADLDGDGNEDVFLSQNCFAMRMEEPRLDAGRGLWLRGDVSGHLTPVPGQVSGVTVYGEQRGAALADFDADGRVDLVVSQNGGATKVYHNVGAKPGLRVRLQGPPGNPTAVGASIRLLAGQKAGPLREIQAGSGYCSQDSAVQVLAMPQPADQIWVRWPGGKETTTVLPSGARSIKVDADGAVTVQ